MGTVRYTVLNGEVIAEKRDGVRLEYIPDPLGSTVALVGSQQNVTDTFSYWPYGEEASRTGVTPTPFLFIGTLGYYFDTVLGMAYVRLRYLYTVMARWLTADPLQSSLGDINFYAYVKGRVLSFVDLMGLQESSCNQKCNQHQLDGCITNWNFIWGTNIAWCAALTAIGITVCTLITTGIPPVVPPNPFLGAACFASLLGLITACFHNAQEGALCGVENCKKLYCPAALDPTQPTHCPNISPRI
jgi:RHS repeat-associated protein